LKSEAIFVSDCLDAFAVPFRIVKLQVRSTTGISSDLLLLLLLLTKISPRQGGDITGCEAFYRTKNLFALPPLPKLVLIYTPISAR
jgi:hypothetical protein